MEWGYSKKKSQAYQKRSHKGFSGSGVFTNPVSDISLKKSSNDSHYKSNKGFLHKNGLTVDVYDAKGGKENKVDPEFVAEVRTAWNESPIETRDMVKRIVIKKVRNENYGWEGRWNRKNKTLTFINFPNPDVERVSGLVRHELDHIWFTERQANNDPQVLEYEKKTDEIKPVTYYAQEFYDRWKQDEEEFNSEAYNKVANSKQKKNYLRNLQYNRNEYYNEQHSETGYLLDLYLKGYSGVVNVDRDNLANAIILYLQLHEELREPILKQIQTIHESGKAIF